MQWDTSFDAKPGTVFVLPYESESEFPFGRFGERRVFIDTPTD